MTAIRSHRRVTGLLLGVCVALPASGCEPDPEIEVIEGEHLDYEWETTREPCVWAASYSDAFVPFAAAQLGLDPDTFAQLTFTSLSYESFLEVPFTEGTSGIAFASHSYSPSMTHLHEVAHTVVHQRRLGGLSFLTEGVAEALTQGSELIVVERDAGRYARFDRIDPRPYLDHRRRRDGGYYYRVAGGFVTYLLSRHGPERFFELHEELTYTSSPRRFAEKFAEVYGRDLGDEVALFLDDDTCPEDATEVPQPYLCAAPFVDWATPERWEDSRALTCFEPADYIEATDDERGVSFEVSLEIPEAGRYRVELFGDTRSAELLSCGRCPWLAEDIHLTPGALEVDLEAGHHALRYYGDAWTALVGARLTRVDDEPP